MALSKSLITGSVLMATEKGLSEASLLFRLSAYDTEVAAVVVPVVETAVLGANGTMPANFRIWQNVAGLRGTSYALELVGKQSGALPGFLEIVAVPLGSVTIGSSAAYNIADLLDQAATGTPVFIDYGSVAAAPTKIADYGDIL